jgi:tight adherence protein B
MGGTLLGMLLGWDEPPALGAGAVAAALPWLWLERQRSVRLRRLEQQLPLALDLMSRALRAGHALPTAVRMVGEEMSDPIAREFRQLADATSFGMGLAEAMARLGRRVPLEDIRYFVTAVLIQRETGGNLAELLDNIAAIVRARLKLLGQVRTLSAEGRISAWILGLLPFGTGTVLYRLNPEFMAFLWTDPQGQRLACFALGAMVVGVFWMRRIIRIRV